MHPYEKAIQFLLNEHIRRGDAHSTAEAERHLAAIAAATPDLERIRSAVGAVGGTVSHEPIPTENPE